MPEFEHLTLEIADAVATIRLNRPAVMNAVTTASQDELRVALDTLKPAGARALVLTGMGRAFCAGADLGGKDFGDAAPGDRTRRDLQQHHNPVIQALASLEIPVVTAVNGAAAGIGCSIALMGDIIIAARSGYFLQAFTNIGLVPDGGSTWLLPRLIGHPLAMRMMLLGERIHGEEAERLGMVTWCVDDEALMDKAMEVAARLAARPTLALGLTRQLARAAHSISLPEALAHEADAQRRALDSNDAREGIAAFLEKRAPVFRGD